MQIKISDKIVSIPPYLSTNWSQIAALHMKGSILVVTLVDGDAINIPNLTKENLDQIFLYHAAYLEKATLSKSPIEKKLEKLENIQHFFEKDGGASIQFAFGTMDGLNTVMQHNPEQSDAPDLPPEILQKVSAIAKILGASDEMMSLPLSVPSCNCFYCQIARTLQPTEVKEEQPDLVKDEELQFQQWAIEQTGDKMYTVTNRLDEHEKYVVYLGEPIGCTCGKNGCEHILAVLKT